MKLKTILITALQRDETVGGVPLPPQHGGSWQVYGSSWRLYGKFLTIARSFHGAERSLFTAAMKMPLGSN